MNTPTSTSGSTTSAGTSDRPSDAGMRGSCYAAGDMSLAGTGWVPAGRDHGDALAARSHAGDPTGRPGSSEHPDAGYGGYAHAGWTAGGHDPYSYRTSAGAAHAGADQPGRRVQVSRWNDAVAALARLLALPAYAAAVTGAVVLLHRWGALDQAHRAPLPIVMVQVLGLALALVAAAVLALWAAGRAARHAGALALTLLGHAVDHASGAKRRRDRANATHAAFTARTAPVVTVLIADAPTHWAVRRVVVLTPPQPALPHRPASRPRLALPAAPVATPPPPAQAADDELASCLAVDEHEHDGHRTDPLT